MTRDDLTFLYTSVALWNGWIVCLYVGGPCVCMHAYIVVRVLVCSDVIYAYIVVCVVVCNDVCVAVCSDMCCVVMCCDAS